MDPKKCFLRSEGLDLVVLSALLLLVFDARKRRRAGHGVQTVQYDLH